MARIVFWRPMYDSTGRELLEAAGHTVEVVDSSDPEVLKAALPGAQALWVRTPEVVTADILDVGTDLCVISTSGFGTDNVDIPAATERGILLVNHPGFGRVPVAEHTVMMLLAVSKRLVWSDRATRDSSAWAFRSDMDMGELNGKTVGIVGLGFIGGEVARILRYGFNCDVVVHDPNVDSKVALALGARTAGELPELLAQSTYLCLCPALNDQTRTMIGREQLALLPEGAIVVNTSRGQVLDVEALTEALESGRVAGAGLDVVYPEPLRDGHPLFSDDRVILTPHTAGLTRETSARLARSAADQLIAVLGGRLPTYPVNPDAWATSASRRPAPTHD